MRRILLAMKSKKVSKMILFIGIIFIFTIIISDKLFARECLYLKEGRPHNYEYHVFLSGKQYSAWKTYHIDYDSKSNPTKIYQMRSVVEVYVHECVCGEARVEYRAVQPETRTIP